MKLSNNFTLEEMTRSSTANRMGIDNSPSYAEIESIKILAERVMQPVRDEFGPVSVNSGFRCPELNRAIGSKDNSQHAIGEAVDISIRGVSAYEVARWIARNLDFDQLILEYWQPHIANSGWVHVSYVNDVQNRNQVLTIDKNGVRNGLG